MIRRFRPQQPHAFNGTDTHLQMPLGQLDVFTFPEDARPFLAGFVEKIVDPVKSDLRIKRLTEFNDLVIRFSCASFSSQILANMSLKISLNSSFPLSASTSSSRS